MKMAIKRLRALLADSQGQIEKMKEQTNQKSQIRTMETKVSISKQANFMSLKVEVVLS